MPSYSSYNFSSEFHRAKDVGVMVLKGELENSQQNALNGILVKAVEKEKCQALIIDITHITYMASFAVAAIGFYFKELNEAEGFLCIVCENEQSLKPFKLAGLAEMIPIFSSIKEALEAIKAQGFC